MRCNQLAKDKPRVTDGRMSSEHQGTKRLTVTAVNRFNRPPAGGYGRLQVMTERLRAVTVTIMKLPPVKAGYGTLSAHLSGLNNTRTVT
ncbi:MAG: hypothetical protein GY821_00565 [Gammaproteobacteria bacterium]|nr:hypothetical protein [Gammaproteobacteria bacterium]